MKTEILRDHFQGLAKEEIIVSRFPECPILFGFLL
jgi:hypothetical protein